MGTILSPFQFFLAAVFEESFLSVVEGPVLSLAEGPVLSLVEGPVLSLAEGPVLSLVEGPVLSLVEGPVLSLVEGPVLSLVEGWIKRVVTVFLRFFFPPRSPNQVHLNDVKRILVVRQHDQLGDMLCVVPLLRVLRINLPDALITLVASPVNYEIMLHHQYLNEILNYDKQLFLRSLLSFVKFYRALRKHRYDLAIVPTTVSISLTSNVIAFVSRARIRLGVKMLNGAPNPTSFLFNLTTSLQWDAEPHRHQTLRNLDLLRPLGISPEHLHTVIGFTDEERSEAARFLASLRYEHNILIGIHPGAGKIANRWPAERFADVANQLCEQFSSAAVITAGPMDDECVNAMMRHIHCPYMLVRRRPIRTVAAIISQLNLFIANDTGIMHVAAASGAPTLSLFGPTDPLQWAPRGKKNRYINGKDEDITSISVQEVVETACKMLSLFLFFVIL